MTPMSLSECPWLGPRPPQARRRLPNSPVTTPTRPPRPLPPLGSLDAKHVSCRLPLLLSHYRRLCGRCGSCRGQPLTHDKRMGSTKRLVDDKRRSANRRTEARQKRKRQPFDILASKPTFRLRPVKANQISLNQRQKLKALGAP